MAGIYVWLMGYRLLAANSRCAAGCRWTGSRALGVVAAVLTGARRGGLFPARLPAPIRCASSPPIWSLDTGVRPAAIVLGLAAARDRSRRWSALVTATSERLAAPLRGDRGSQDAACVPRAAAHRPAARGCGRPSITQNLAIRDPTVSERHCARAQQRGVTSRRGPTRLLSAAKQTTTPDHGRTALAQSSGSMIWNFKQIAHHTLDGFGGMGEGMSMQLTKDGRRILWLAHESAPKNFTAVDVTDPRNPKIVARADLPQVAHALQLAGDGRRHPRRRLPDPAAGPAAGRVRAVRHLDPGKPAADLVYRLLRPAFARRAPALVRRRRDHPHVVGRARLHPDPPQGRPVLPQLRRAQPVEADRDRPLVAARPDARRQRGAAEAPPGGQRQRLSPAQHQRLPRAARTACTWAISTAG